MRGFSFDSASRALSVLSERHFCTPDLDSLRWEPFGDGARVFRVDPQNTGDPEDDEHVFTKADIEYEATSN